MCPRTHTGRKQRGLDRWGTLYPSLSIANARFLTSQLQQTGSSHRTGLHPAPRSARPSVKSGGDARTSLSKLGVHTYNAPCIRIFTTTPSNVPLKVPATAEKKGRGHGPRPRGHFTIGRQLIASSVASCLPPWKRETPLVRGNWRRGDAGI